MKITQQHLIRHYADTRALLREYFPCADGRAIIEYVEALRAFDLFPNANALNRLMVAHHVIVSSLPTIEIDDERKSRRKQSLDIKP